MPSCPHKAASIWTIPVHGPAHLWVSAKKLALGTDSPSQTSAFSLAVLNAEGSCRTGVSQPSLQGCASGDPGITEPQPADFLKCAPTVQAQCRFFVVICLLFPFVSRVITVLCLVSPMSIYRDSFQDVVSGSPHRKGGSGGPEGRLSLPAPSTGLAVPTTNNRALVLCQVTNGMDAESQPESSVSPSPQDDPWGYDLSSPNQRPCSRPAPSQGSLSDTRDGSEAA